MSMNLSKAFHDSFSITKDDQPIQTIYKLSIGMGKRAWMLDRAIGEPFVLSANFPAATNDDLIAFIVECDYPLKFDMGTDVRFFEDVPDDNVLVCLYPSGTVRSLSAHIINEAGKLTLEFDNLLNLLDPDEDAESAPLDNHPCSMRIVALKGPSCE